MQQARPSRQLSQLVSFHGIRWSDEVDRGMPLLFLIVQVSTQTFDALMEERTQDWDIRLLDIYRSVRVRWTKAYSFSTERFGGLDKDRTCNQG